VIHAAMKELREEGSEFDENIDIGIMIEVPAAALLADDLARHTSFFSIGTNDLVQYTLAADRTNKRVASLYRELNPAVLKLIQLAITAGTKANIPVTLCGEMAGRVEAVPLLLGMGLASFSVVPPQVGKIKKVIAALKSAECEQLARRISELTTTEKVETVLHEWCRHHIAKEFLEE
jgi:phosphotransferase system enzyme I (PtsI)